MVVQDFRDRPYKYINRAIALLQEKISSGAQYNYDIVEIGSMRSELTHDVDDTGHPCCNDGHSSYLFARTGMRVESFNIDIEHAEATKKSCEQFPNFKIHCMDAFDWFGKDESAMVGLLFLDAWDLDVPGYQEKHLEFFKKYIVCNPKPDYVLIDDTDLWYDPEKKEYFDDPECMSGKGKLLIPYLLNNGYKIVFNGRQTLLDRI